MSKKKKKEKKKTSVASAADLESEVHRLREENEMLRARLEKIGELAGDLPRVTEDKQYDELTRDADDQNADGGKRIIEPAGVGLS